jgi:hypothetical protein
VLKQKLFVGSAMAIKDIYSQIEEALRNQYSIGYTPI